MEEPGDVQVDVSESLQRSTDSEGLAPGRVGAEVEEGQVFGAVAGGAGEGPWGGGGGGKRDQRL